MNKMKAVFLDIDGVLNKNNTKEMFSYMNSEFQSLDPRLLKIFMDWYNTVDVKIVLSSTWRNVWKCREILRDNGIDWVAETPRDKTRGLEIDQILSKGWIDKYVILDDLGTSEFLKYQRRYLVQTSPFHGIETKKIKKMNEILYG